MVVYGYLLFEQNSLPLQNKITLVGRAPSCHLVFSHPSISKEHSLIEFSDHEGAVIKDLNTMNGVYVNENRIPKGGQAYLYNNTRITFGKDPINYTFVFSSEYEKMRSTNPKTAAAQGRQTISETKKYPGEDTTINLVEQHREHLEAAQNSRAREFMSSYKKPNEYERNLEDFQQKSTANPQKGLNAPFSAGKLPGETVKSQGEYSSSWQKSEMAPRLQSPQITNDFVEKKSNLIHHNELLELNERVLEKEEAVLKKENEINLYNNEIESLRDECGRIKSKLHAVELYAFELQRKNDLLTQEIAERNSIIQELQSTDLGVKAQLNMNEVKSLRQLLLTKDEEIGSLKRQLKAVLQSQSDPGVNINHYEGFLEQQALELASTKKQLQEYENRAEECKRKWNQLIKENIGKEEKIKGLTFQLNRQIESYQALYAETDRKFSSLNAKFISLVNEDRDSRERQAAEYLVEQMAEIQEERERIASENEQLHLQTQELIEETKRMGEEIEEYQRFFENNGTGVSLDDKTAGQTLAKMRVKIEELEDLLYEIKQNEGVRKTTELNDTIGDIERKLATQERANQDLKNKLSEAKANGSTVHEQSTIDFFSKLLEEKDQMITYLKTQNDVFTSKEKQYQIEIEHLRDHMQQGALQFENYKQRQSRLENVLTNKAGPPTSHGGLSVEQRIPAGRSGGVPDIKFSFE